MNPFIQKKLAILVLLMVAMFQLTAQDIPGPAKNSSGKWGYTNKSGTVVIDYQFDAAQAFSNDMAAVKKKGLWGFVTAAGDLAVDYQYDDAWFFTDGLAAVKSLDKWGYINKKGVVVIPLTYQDAAEFVDGLAWVKKDGLLGYINTSGETIIPFQYKAAVSFANGYALAYKDTGWGAIDTKGTAMAGLSAFIFDDARPYVKELAPVYSKSAGKWGLVGTDGKLKVDYTFSSPDVDRTTSEYAWGYAATSYTNKDKISLAKAVALIEKLYLTTYDYQRLIPYYEMLGDDAKESAARKTVKTANKAAKASSRSSSSSADFSIACAPLKLAMYDAGKYSLHQVPLYAELRLGTVGIGARYNTYSDYHDKYRFGAMTLDNQDSTLVYSGSEMSLIMKFFQSNDMSRGYKGYGHTGAYYGFELRYADLKCNDIPTEVYDENSLVVAQTYIAPQIKRYDASMIIGMCNSRKLFFWDFGMNIGAGYKQYDFGEYDVKGYTYSDERLTEGWTPAYLVLRCYFRFGINLF